MRTPTPEQELIALRDHVGRILAAGCPETTRLPERAWALVHQALALAAQAAEVKAEEKRRRREKGSAPAAPLQRAA